MVPAQFAAMAALALEPCSRRATSCGALSFRPTSSFREPAPPPRWLQKIRSAQAVKYGPLSLGPNHILGGRATGANNGFTYVQCVFTSPLSPAGPCVTVEAALVDTGSSDCELCGNLLARLPALPVVMRGAIYETATGAEAFDAYEVLLTVHGKTAAVVVTACDESSSDDALVGHMALGALGLDVDCIARRLLLPSYRHEAMVKTSAQEVSFGCADQVLKLKQGSLRAEGPMQIALGRPYSGGWWPGQQTREAPAVDARGQTQEEEEKGMVLGGHHLGIAPRWTRCNSCAVALAGLPPGDHQDNSEGEMQESSAREVIPVTYVQCRFRSPLSPTGPSVTVAAALVDTGSADCELRESLLRQLGPLPIVARGIAYETVSGRIVQDGYEVLLTVNGRSCAAVITNAPEERFAVDGDDPNSDEAVIGFAALAALGIIVDCGGRRVRHRAR